MTAVHRGLNLFGRCNASFGYDDRRLCVGLLTSTKALAQVPPDPNDPNEPVPDAMAQPQYGEPIVAVLKRQ